MRFMGPVEFDRIEPCRRRQGDGFLERLTRPQETQIG